MACRAIKDYLPSIDGGPVLIDPQFRATMLSQSKIWTIKGFASCPNTDNKSYIWIVILNYYDMQEWEILAKIRPSMTTIADSRATFKTFV